MNNLRAKQIFENIKKDGILSERELEAIQYLIDKRQAINCHQCSFYVPNIEDSSEFFAVCINPILEVIQTKIPAHGQN